MELLSSLILILLSVVSVETLTGKCGSTYCSQHNNPQFINWGCCTFKSASNYRCCLNVNPDSQPADSFTESGCGCSCCSDAIHPTWAGCVADWKNCCQCEYNQVNYCPMYIGVDWQSDASYCTLCNRGTWESWDFPGFTMVSCDPIMPPNLLCSSEQEGKATMLCLKVVAKE
eukprot:161640-Ditylum_brightwellii.AAC.1